MNINLHTWFSARELTFCPKHFVGSKTFINTERYIWITEKLIGRFYITNFNHSLFMLFNENSDDFCIYFEDPAEAMYFELTWA